jgi:hypothetical protein
MEKRMKKYIENPKTKGSGILAAIPQTGTCPNNCEDCFFQSGRSYLEPLVENLPNLPPLELMKGRVIRINDGNDSNVKRDIVLKYIEYLKENDIDCFVNTSEPNLDFGVPAVLTVNPGDITDKNAFLLMKPSKELMMVRARVNTWNRPVIDAIVEHYSTREIPVILTFMAYYKTNPIPEYHKKHYRFRKRTLNSYWAITTKAWEMIMKRYKYNKWIHSCGKIEGEKGDTHCRFCGNCIREYFATMVRMR